MRASWKIASVVAGRIRWRQPSAVRSPVVHQPIRDTSPRPKDGSHSSSTLKTRMRRMPMRNVGSDMPSTEPPMRSFETTLSGFTAARIPAGMPRARASSIVAGRRSAKRSATGAPGFCVRLRRAPKADSIEIEAFHSPARRMREWTLHHGEMSHLPPREIREPLGLRAPPPRSQAEIRPQPPRGASPPSPGATSGGACRGARAGPP